MTDSIIFSEAVPLNVLIIEDEAPDTALVSSQLRSLWPDCKILSASSLRKAKVVYQKNDVDIVLLDLNLPDSMGPESVRGARGFVRAPIIVMTGLLTTITSEEAIKLGANAVVSKTQVMSDDFYAVLEAHTED